jgi:hypothetical protein
MRNVLGFVLILLGCSLAHAQAHPPRINGKPVYHQEVLPVVESTLARMWDATEIVVEVKIERSDVKAVGGSRTPRVSTYHTARVIHSLKGNMKAGTDIVFTELAGQLELADRILIGANGEPLPVGERYIVFLARNDVLDTWALRGQRAGAFKLHEGRVQPQGFGAVAEEQRGVTERQFSDELERLSRRDRQAR